MIKKIQFVITAYLLINLNPPLRAPQEFSCIQLERIALKRFPGNRAAQNKAIPLLRLLLGLYHFQCDDSTGAFPSGKEVSGIIFSSIFFLLNECVTRHPWEDLTPINQLSCMLQQHIENLQKFNPGDADLYYGFSQLSAPTDLKETLLWWQNLLSALEQHKDNLAKLGDKLF